MDTLKIVDLCVEVDNKLILNKFNLIINSNETHVIMGPNGMGKSTLLKVIMGDPNYKILSGEIYYNDTLLNDKTVDERSRMGIFLGMQLPMEIEGVTSADMLRTARSIREQSNFKLMPFIKEIDGMANTLKMDKDMIHRDINKGFSGGERKKNEILQMYMLHPSLVMLDEIDSGLDVDSLKIVGEAVHNYKETSNCGLLLITHYQRLLDYIKPDFVHIMADGHIIKTGDYTLVKDIEENGYIGIKNDISSASIIRDKDNNE